MLSQPVGIPLRDAGWLPGQQVLAGQSPDRLAVHLAVLQHDGVFLAVTLDLVELYQQVIPVHGKPEGGLRLFWPGSRTRSTLTVFRAPSGVSMTSSPSRRKS